MQPVITILRVRRSVTEQQLALFSPIWSQRCIFHKVTHYQFPHGRKLSFVCSAVPEGDLDIFCSPPRPPTIKANALHSSHVASCLATRVGIWFPTSDPQLEGLSHMKQWQALEPAAHQESKWEQICVIVWITSRSPGCANSDGCAAQHH